MIPFPLYSTRASGLPFISISLAILSLVFYCSGDAAAFLQYDRSAIANGEAWRIITGHFAHWSLDHFLWCTITFLVLGSICEKLNKKGFIISLAASAIIIPFACWFLAPGMILYRGLSGLCSSIFILGSGLMIRNALVDREWLHVILPAAGGVLFFAKILYEFIYGQTLFVQSNELFSPVPLAHLVGGIVGLATVLFMHFYCQTRVSE